MSIERWGSLSVADHQDAHALVANVLLYDRLVMPMCTESDDRKEFDYWESKHWDPLGQRERRKQLGELVVECAWDLRRRQAYSERFEAARQLDAEANGEATTRSLLSMEKPRVLPAGVNHADVFVAYASRAQTRKDHPEAQAGALEPGDEARVGVLIAHELGVPDIADPEAALKEAIGLALDTGFRNRRADLYDFQMSCLHRGMAPPAIVAELRDRNRELTAYLKQQKIPLRKKTGFMLAQTTLGIVGGVFGYALPAIGGLVSIWKFASTEMTQTSQVPYRLAPVAAFNDIHRKLKLTL